MRDDARAQAAIEVLDAWLAGRHLEGALGDWARGARYAGSKDRAAVRDLVYDAVRRKGSAARVGGVDGRGLILGALRLAGVDPATRFTGAPHAPSPLPPGTGTAAAVCDPLHDIPDWLQPALRVSLGSDLPEIAKSFTQRAPLYLRVAAGVGPERAIAALGAEGVSAVSRGGLAIEVTDGARAVRGSEPYRRGWVEPQDLSVQRACAALAPVAGVSILDYCAGGGGKSLALADMGARVMAHDADPARMADLAPRAARAGLSIETTLAPTGPFDLVLLDVPCSGSGTWRRDPEAKWRLTPDRLDELLALQARILTEASRHVGMGGRLVYMTCSLLEAENGAQIDRFLAADPGFVDGPRHVWTPLTASDGFFAAILTKSGVSGRPVAS